MPPLTTPPPPPTTPLHRRAIDTGPDPDLDPGPGPGPDDGDDPTASNLVNMYFLILALFAVLLVCTLWYWRRSKRREALASLGVRQTALVADLEMRRRRGDDGGGGGEEGEGEAPPPYVTRPERAAGGLPKYEEVVGNEVERRSVGEVGAGGEVVRERREDSEDSGGGGLGAGGGGGTEGVGDREGERGVSVAVPPPVH
ncbi:uncharacterized protein H6S33_000913 [Morchella sextelata]|uniref:uncharacterized protein n=1 Tax=Morchella sextelata TaxID=1174677 RepID=UPI001D0516DE|nr:uncharacterized protein H6S33_000913 [Morchella sextelata]KAH0615277.1 hypothetical protein H6S33_000913 [Morchella sextelata]